MQIAQPTYFVYLQLVNSIYVLLKIQSITKKETLALYLNKVYSFARFLLIYFYLLKFLQKNADK